MTRSVLLRVPVIVAGILVLLAALLSSPASASTRTFKWPANRLSNQFNYYSCPYKIFYGKISSSGRYVAFAQLRVYSGCSGSMKLSLYSGSGSAGTGCTSQSCPGGGGAQDGCGSYLWMQAPTLEVTPSETVYMSVTFPDGGVRYFRPDRGEAITGRAC